MKISLSRRGSSRICIANYAPVNWNTTPWVQGKDRGFDTDPGQKASISLPPKARVQIKRPYPWGKEDENIKTFKEKDMYLNGEIFQVYMYKYAVLITLLVQ